MGSQTQSLPKLNPLDLSLVNVKQAQNNWDRPDFLHLIIESQFLQVSKWQWESCWSYLRSDGGRDSLEQAD